MDLLRKETDKFGFANICLPFKVLHIFLVHFTLIVSEIQG